MNIEDPQASVIVLLILYMVVKDVVTPMVRKLAGTKNDNDNTSIKVLETKFDNMKEDISEIKKTLTTLLTKG